MEQVQIFISYAREDKNEVMKIYRRLEADGFKPWIDEKDIIAGSRWREEIEKALRQCDFFLLCLSPNSANKRGFIQREIRFALDLCQEKLQDDIYIIPIRLEDCEVPASVSDFQWLDWFEEDGWDDLLRSLRAQMKRLGKATRAAPLPSPLTAQQPPAKTPPPSPLLVQSVTPPPERRVGKIYEPAKRATTQPAPTLPLPPPPRTTKSEFATIRLPGPETAPQRSNKSIFVGIALAISIAVCIAYLVWSRNRHIDAPSPVEARMVEVLHYSLDVKDRQGIRYLKIRFTTRANGYLYLIGYDGQSKQPITELTNHLSVDCGQAKNSVRDGVDFVFPCRNRWYQLVGKSAQFTLVYSPTILTNFGFLNAPDRHVLTVEEQQALESLRTQSARREPNIKVDEGRATVRARAALGDPLLIDFVAEQL